MKPSVTQLLNLLDKPALMKWANKIGLQGIGLDEYRKNSLAKGASLHSEIEKYLRDKTPFTNPAHEQACIKFFSDKEILAAEQSIETDHFVGRLDIRFRWNEKVYVCDFKSNQSGIYFENKLQLTAYRMAAGADGVAIISIPEFTLIPVSIKDFAPYEKILINLSSVFLLKKECESI